MTVRYFWKVILLSGAPYVWLLFLRWKVVVLKCMCFYVRCILLFNKWDENFTHWSIYFPFQLLSLCIVCMKHFFSFFHTIPYGPSFYNFSANIWVLAGKKGFSAFSLIFYDTWKCIMLRHASFPNLIKAKAWFMYCRIM